MQGVEQNTHAVKMEIQHQAALVCTYMFLWAWHWERWRLNAIKSHWRPHAVSTAIAANSKMFYPHVGVTRQPPLEPLTMPSGMVLVKLTRRSGLRFIPALLIDDRSGRSGPGKRSRASLPASLAGFFCALVPVVPVRVFSASTALMAAAAASSNVLPRDGPRPPDERCPEGRSAPLATCTRQPSSSNSHTETLRMSATAIRRQHSVQSDSNTREMPVKPTAGQSCNNVLYWHEGDITCGVMPLWHTEQVCVAALGLTSAAAAAAARGACVTCRHTLKESA